VILGAAYILWLVQRVFYGPESPMAATQPAMDLHLSEWVAVAPLAVLMLLMGVVPNVWLRDFQQAPGPSQTRPAKLAQSAQPGSNTPSYSAEAR
jgi:NADH-quinone oxidoreductase subunit M